MLALTAITVTGAGAARAEYVRSGDLLVSFDAGLKPSTLPRSEAVPVTVGFKGTFENLDATDTPPLDTMEVRIASGGRIDAVGLPRCGEARLRERSSAEALAACRDALVGEGTVSSAVRFPDGRRMRSTARLLLFNDTNRILMHIYTVKPLRGTFLVPMSIRRTAGAFGTVLRARFPRIAAGYGYLTGFRMVLHRTFRSGGRKRSYLVASCPLPPGFGSATFELAQFTYRFRGGFTIRSGALGSCRVP